MDRGYSTRNLRRVWDAQVRRGAELAHLYPDVQESLRDLRDQRAELTSRRKAVAQPDASQKARSDYAESQDQVHQAREAVERVLTMALHETGSTIQEQISSQEFSWPLAAGPTRRGKPTYNIGKSANTYFASKVLEGNIGALLRVQPMSRDSIVGQLIQCLSDPLPKYITRVDIESFFESIDHASMLKVLRDRGLGKSGIYLVERLLGAYEDATGRPIGLPRGVGLSSRLAELYLQELDLSIRRSPGVILSARYVDDIIVISGASTTSISSESTQEQAIKSKLHDLGLRAHAEKTRTISALSGGNFGRWEFLGYSFHKSGSLEVKLIKSRVDQLKRRLDLAFAAWDSKDATNTGIQGLLLNRVKLLTGNTRLSNNKRNAMVGSFFSHRHVSSLQQFRHLDEHLHNLVETREMPPVLSSRISSLSFEIGFTERTIHRLTPRQIGDATRLWRNV